MAVMDATKGGPLTGADALAQSAAIVLTTPIGSRPMRRDFGSLLFDLIDGPVNAAMPMLLRAATAVALARWIPTITLSRVTLSGAPASGNLSITIEATDSTRPPANARISLTIPIRRSVDALLATS